MSERDWKDKFRDEWMARYVGPEEVRVRYERPPRPAPPLRQRFIDAWRVLVGKAYAVPLETGPQVSEWSEPEVFNPKKPPPPPPSKNPRLRV